MSSLALFGIEGLPEVRPGDDLAGMIADDRRGATYKQGFDALYPALATKYALPLYPYFLEGVANDPALTQEGGLHPNAAGVRAIVTRVAPLVERTLDDLEHLGLHILEPR